MEEHFIPGVHNYCDRWCDRCPFTARCRVYVSEQEFSEDAKDPADPAFWQNIKKNFEGVLEMLNKMMAEMGIDPEEMDKLPAPKPDPDIQALEIAMREKTARYANAVDDFFRGNAPYFEEKGEELEAQIQDGRPVDVEKWQFFQDAVDVIRWYQYFISAKIHRAVNSMEHLEEFDDPKQSDSNGSAKVVIIAIERSLGAWEVLSRQLPEKHAEIVGLQRQLQYLHTELCRLFPDWNAFHRPGFDDEPGQTMRLDFNPN
ncbi:MAG: hypothetical protein IPH12_19585 [Saprospirales bacterium]|jgi:hypothetical protein|nr:hypothetical protein [Saprospirales bacterium]MBK8921656.1 hypothetical protein [Saprospirales bacterium]